MRFKLQLFFGLSAVWLCLFLLTSITRLWGQSDNPSLRSQEEKEQVQNAERLLTILEKNPRKGTAFDRVYGHHLDFGTLDIFIDQLDERIEKSNEDDEAWMLLGLFESQRGEDEKSVDAFRKSVILRPADPLASYYLGQALVRVGQTSEAIEALEQAIERKPTRADLLEIFQYLGRLHQRAQRTNEAIKVWRRLEELFPDDLRVLEEIAVALAEEGDFASAMSRYERLSKLVDDDYRRILFRMAAAEMKFKTNLREEGITELEAILLDLKPDSWLYREVRRRIDETFLKTYDQDGLVKYYQKWLAAHSEDIEGMTRLAKFLAASARVPEANSWMEKALTLAPTRTDLRRAYINLLIDDHRIPEAIRQYEQLAVYAPGDADILRDWGKLVLKDKSQDIDTRKKEAIRIWKQMITSRPDDASNIARVADLFRQSLFYDEATSLYHKAIELAPNEPQYREYLGEFFYIQKQTDEAQKTWAAIAADDRHNVVNVTRLADVYNRFGFCELAAAQIAGACRMDPKDLRLQIHSSEYHLQADQFDRAIEFVAAAEKLVENDDDREIVFKQKIEVLQSCQRLQAEALRLSNELQYDPSATAEQWHLLARYQESDRQWAVASRSIQKAQAIDSKSISILTTAARISEATGNLGQTISYCRELAALDRRSLGDHLMNIARLEAQRNRPDEAIKAARELIVSAPGNTDNYEFLSQMCTRFGRHREALDALQKAVRINPNEPHLIMALGNALADQSRTNEAIEIYWRAFDKTDTLDDKTSLIIKLVALHKKNNQSEKVIERLDRESRVEENRRVMTMCLAQAYYTMGLVGKARQELESLLIENTRDTNLLQQLAKLCESSKELDAAIIYQRQLVAIAPGGETELPLAKMLQARGDREEAAELLISLTQREEDPIRLLRSIDSLLTHSSFKEVIRITEPLLSKNRDDWELLYREGVAMASLDRISEATNRFENLLALSIPHDVLGVGAEASAKKSLSKAKSENMQGAEAELPNIQLPLNMLRMASSIRNAVGLASDQATNIGNLGMSPVGLPMVWTPDVFGTARMAAYAWLLKFEEIASSEKQEGVGLAERMSQQAINLTSSQESIYDSLYVATLLSKKDESLTIARRLARTGGSMEQEFFLTSLLTRSRKTSHPAGTNPEDISSAEDRLPDGDLELMLTSFEGLPNEKKCSRYPTSRSSQIVNATNIVNTTNIANTVSGTALLSSGGGFRFASNASPSTSETLLSAVVRELRLAGQTEKGDELLTRFVADATSTFELRVAMNCYAAMERYDMLPSLYANWCIQAKQEITKHSASPSTNQNRSSMSTGQLIVSQASSMLMKWIGNLGPDKKHAEIFSILDSALDLSLFDAKQRRVVRSVLGRRSSSNSRTIESRPFAVQLSYGKEFVSTSIDFPSPNDCVDQTTLSLLREAFEIFKRNNAVDELVEHSRERLARFDEGDRSYEQLLLAAILWWAEDQDESVELMTQASVTMKEDVNLQFAIATLHEKRGDFYEALDVIESVNPLDKQLEQRKELLISQYAERIGNIQRASEAAEKLLGMQLDAASEVELWQRASRLGLSEVAKTIQERMKKRVVSKTSMSRTTTRTLATSSNSSVKLTGDANKDCDLYLELFRKDPDLILRELNTTEPLFTRANRTVELVQAIRGLDFRKLKQPNLIGSQMSSHFQTAKDSEVAVAFWEKAIELSPQYISNMLYALRRSNSGARTQERFDQMLRRLLIPTASQVLSDPWKGVNDIHDIPVDGTAGGIFHLVLQSCKTSEARDSLANSIQEKVQQMPHWIGGRMMLAIIDFKESRQKEAIDNLEPIFDHGFEISSVPINACWIVGQELARFEQAQPIATKLLERMVANSGVDSSTQLDRSPVGRLAELYVKQDRRDEAREILLRQLETHGTANSSIPQPYSALFHVQRSWWVANKCLELDFVIDAIRLYREILDNPQIYQDAAVGVVRFPEFGTQCNDGLKKALESLKKKGLRESIAQLFSAPRLGPETPALELLISTPKGLKLKEKIESQLIELLSNYLTPDSTHSDLDVSEAAKLLNAELLELQSKHANDISIRVVLALIRMRANSDQADDALQSLLKLVNDHPLAEISDGHRASASQRREAALSIPLWLVARECLVTDKRKSIGQQFAERALDGARRQLGTQQSVAMLTEWSQLMFVSGDASQAEDKLFRLLAIITERPHRKYAVNKPSEALEPIPPLTMAQFKIASTLATVAHESGMQRLSMKAVREAMRGGFPLPEPAPTEPAYGIGFSSTGGTVIMSRSVSSSPSSVTSNTTKQGTDSEVTPISWLRRILVSWEGGEYSAEEVYEVLKEIILPPSRPNTILMNSIATSTSESKETNLNQLLVNWAKKAGMQDELSQQLETLKKGATAQTLADADTIQALIEKARK